MRNWIEVKIKILPETSEAVSNFLFENQSSGLVVDADYIISYFKEEKFDNSISEKLRKYLKELQNLGFEKQTAKFSVRSVRDKDWNRYWKKDLKPIEISNDILIVPSWIKKYPKEYDIIIKLDPGMAFGSGYHPSTKIAAILVKKYGGGRKKMLDAGTGTGILTLVGKKTGIDRITSIDNYSLAIDICKENIKKNNISLKDVKLIDVDLKDLKENDFDLIAANIDRKVLTENIDLLHRILTTRGIIVFSGILKRNKHKFLSVLDKKEFKLLEEIVAGDWIGFAAEKI